MERVAPILKDLTSDLTSAWLSLAMGCEVIDFKWKYLKRSPGCVVLCYSIESNGTAPTSLVLKCHDMDPSVRSLQVLSLMYEREVYFYQNIVQQLENMNIPKIYAVCRQSEEFYYVLMENLHEQWVPCRFNPDGAISKDTMRLAMMDIQKLHLKFWRNDLLNSFPFFEKEVLRDQLQRILDFKKNWRELKPLFPKMAGWRSKEANGYPTNMQKLVNYLDHCAIDDNALVYYRKANELLGERPFTLVHGDLNCSNFFFRREAERSTTICWIDFGMTRSGPIALDFLTMWSTVSIAEEGLSRGLIREYYDKLRIQLPEIETSYPVDLLLNDICLFFGANIMAVVTMMATTNMSRGAWMFWGQAWERLIHHLWEPFNACSILYSILDIKQD